MTQKYIYEKSTQNFLCMLVLFLKNVRNNGKYALKNFYSHNNLYIKYL